MNDITFALTRQEAEIVLLSIQKQPYEIVVNLIQKLGSQFQEQIRKGEDHGEVETAP